MNKFILTSFSLFSLTFLTIGQTPTINWSEPVELKNIYDNRKIMYDGEDDIYISYVSGYLRDKRSVSKYNKFKKDKDVEIDTRQHSYYTSFENDHFFGGHYLILNKSIVDSISTHSILKYSADIEEEGKLLDLVSYEGENNHIGMFYTRKSDNGKFLLFSWMRSFGEDEYSLIEYVVLNEDLKIHQKGEFRAPILNKFMRKNEPYLSNDGTFFLLMTEFDAPHEMDGWSQDEDRTFNDVLSNYKCLHAIKGGINSMQVILIDFKGKRPEGIKMGSSDGNKLSIVYLYGDNEAKWNDHGVKGVVSLQVDFEIEGIITEQSSSFSQKMVDENTFTNYRQKVQSGGKINDLIARDFTLLNDGSAIFIIEQFNRSSMNLDNQTPHIGGNIITCKFDVKGDVEWVKQIDRKQKASLSLESFMSQKCIVMEEKVIYFFNDILSNYDVNGRFIENKELELVKLMVNTYKKSAFCMVEMDIKTGTIIRRTVLNMEPDKWVECPKYCRYKDGKMLLFSYNLRKGMCRFGEFKL